MLFTSYGFLAFLAILFAIYYLAPRKWQWGILLVASYAFYAFAGPQYLLFILLTTLSSYLVSRLLDRGRTKEEAYLALHKEDMPKEARKAYKAAQKKKRFSILVGGLVLNFGVLAVLKYTGFAVYNLNGILGAFGREPLTIPSLLLPMGISFYTFQTMGYLVDVYRGKVNAEKNPARLALFVSFFPQLVQGPISRYSDLAEQLYAEHRFDSRAFTSGLWRILWGFFKKLVIADRVLVAMNTMLDAPEQFKGAYVLLLILLYSAQIYADFTGGIDITIGVAEALGIRLAENFDRPFSSTSTKEYWRRWHITMGTWFTDYVFYPISVCRPMMKLSKWSRAKLGTAVGKRIPVYLATIVTWFLTGLWHGAGWNFIVWGLLNCAVILISQELEPLYRRFHTRFPRLGSSRGYHDFAATRTFLLMGLIRSLDCYRSVGTSFRMWGSMLTTWNVGEVLGGGILTLGLSVADFVILAFAIALVFFVSRASAKGSVREWLWERPVRSAMLAILLLMTVLLFGAYGHGYDASQFIYNQF